MLATSLPGKAEYIEQRDLRIKQRVLSNKEKKKKNRTKRTEGF